MACRRKCCRVPCAGHRPCLCLRLTALGNLILILFLFLMLFLIKMQALLCEGLPPVRSRNPLYGQFRVGWIIGRAK